MTPLETMFCVAVGCSTAIGMVLGYLWAFGETDRASRIWSAILIGVLFAAIGTMIGLVAGGGYCWALTDGHPCTSVESVSLKAAGNTAEIEGSFFLFGGVIDEEQVYRYYYYSNDCPEGVGTCIKQETIPARLSTIVEEDRTDGVLNKCARLTPEARSWGCPIPPDGENDCYSNMFVFHIPRGSVVNEFKFTV